MMESGQAVSGTTDLVILSTGTGGLVIVTLAVLLIVDVDNSLQVMLAELRIVLPGCASASTVALKDTCLVVPGVTDSLVKTPIFSSDRPPAC